MYLVGNRALVESAEHNILTEIAECVDPMQAASFGTDCRRRNILNADAADFKANDIHVRR